jgi:hypothetical protein
VRLLKLVLIMLCLLVIISSVGPNNFIFEFPYHLITGWAYYLTRALPQITWNVDLLLSSLLALSLATWGLHRLAAWCWSTPQPNSVPCSQHDISINERSGTTTSETTQQLNKKPWQLRWTFAITTMLLLLFASANAGAGIGHQLGWLKTMPWIENASRAHIMTQCNSVRQLIISVRGWAGDHNGGYPQQLSGVVKEEFIDAASFPKLAFWHPRNGTTPEPWLYLGSQLKDDSPSDLPLIASPRPERGNRIVGMNDATVVTMTEANFSKAIEKLNLYLKGLPPSVQAQ